jgi:cytokinin dehydrogenase
VVGDVGQGFLLIFPVKRSRITRPFFRVPDADGNGWVYLFDILTTSLLPGPDPAFAGQMLARNRRLFDAARAVGGVRYPIGSVDFSVADWKAHYGDRWPDLLARKHQFDPDRILTPGPGIFA